MILKTKPLKTKPHAGTVVREIFENMASVSAAGSICAASMVSEATALRMKSSKSAIMSSWLWGYPGDIKAVRIPGSNGFSTPNTEISAMSPRKVFIFIISKSIV